MPSQPIPEDQVPAWHALPADAVSRQLDVEAERGLAADEAAARLARFGPNRLPAVAGRSAWRRFLSQFNNVLLYVLLAAGAVTATMGHWVDAGVIFGVVVINAVIGHIQEGRAEAALDAIRQLLSLKAIVLRDGQRVELDAEQLVPGDVVVLQSGDKVPADLRLIACRSLRIDEAAITGESAPVDKQTGVVDAACALADRSSMAYSGTLVTYGLGRGVVVGSGAATEIGRISSLLHAVKPLTTPLLRQMARFSASLTWAILAVSVLVFGVGVLWRGYGWGDMFVAVVGLAVAAIPEGLPAIMTITLAIGVRRMAQRQAIIRHLPAVEALGSVSVICTDKTGTLTRNEMMVCHLATAAREWAVSGSGYAPDGGLRENGTVLAPESLPELALIGRAAVLCNDARLRNEAGRWLLEGDPTEGALLTLAMKLGLDPAIEREARPRIDVIPFESEYRFMATLHHGHDGDGLLFVKGAPEKLLALCRLARQGEVDVPLDLAYWQACCDRLAARGERLLALAAKPVADGRRQLGFGDVEQGLSLLAIVGMSDPPRAEAIASVRQCHEAGIDVKMITGDHAATALAIGAELGLYVSSGALTGQALDALPAADWPAAVARTGVFARVSPEHKLRLVEALQAQGRVVAMTGDGVNDAPALKRANVGVAMGMKGTEAAKEAAQMVLADDNFASITHAVEEGRAVYDNLKKAFIQILPTNIAEACLILFPVLFGIALPITPVQILWVNMICAVTLSLSLAFEPAEAGVMRRPPRSPREPLLSPLLVWRTAFVSALLTAGSLAVHQWLDGQGESELVARTAAVNTLVVAEAFYLFNCRYLVDPVLSWRGLTGNRMVLLAVGVLVLQQLAFTYLPVMNTLFGTAPLSLAHWWPIIGFGLLTLLVIEVEKRVIRGRARR
ncbi:HAD-IC family P-type ATPase [Chitinivorax sp. PXF-14]|uniref:HAD-IC family P-type ATPase n=1 Tax=Chitinivorax sp. PXF-14 TaxID=3230488 RepID=UPI003465ACEB